MSDRPSDNLGGLDIDLARRIDEVCRRFEADWRAGRQPRIEDYLVEVSDEGRPALRAELEALECELRHSEETAARPVAVPATAADAEPRTAPHPSTIAEAPTLASGTLPTSLVPGAAHSQVHEEATVPPGTPTGAPYDQPTALVLGQDPSATPGASEPTHIRYFGDYEITRELARGGMGVVFLARQISLNRPVALKMILAGQLANDTDVKRFYTEAEAAANLDHPGIVPIYEVGQHAGQHYFSMGFVEGQSLAQKLAGGPLPPREAAALMVKVAETIEYAHQGGVIHRDLKPANILLDRAGNPRVTDFGLAKKLEGDSGLTGSGQIMGTPSYMPPEQAGGHRGEVGRAADVYALGATLYALVAGRPPFQAATAMDTVLQVINDEPVPPRRLNPSVPRDLETSILKCLEKEPVKRYASASALAEDLRRYLAGEPILARPVGPPERAWRWCRRNPIVAGAVGLVAAALVVAAVLSLLYADRQTRLATSESLRADEQTRHSAEQAKAAASLKAALSQSNRLLAIRNFDRGQAAFEKAQIGPGLLWMIESWRSAVEAGDLIWQHAARANLAAWRPHYPRLKAVFSHTMPVGGAAFSPDGRTVISCSEDGTAQLWDATSGKSIGPSLRVGSLFPDVGFSPDGKTAWTCTDDGAPGLWDATTGEPVGLPLSLPPQFHRLAHAIEAGGKIVLVGSEVNADNVAWRWDTATGKPIGPPLTHHGHIYFAVFSPDGRIILTASDDGTARFWDTVTGQPIGPPLKRPGGFRSAAFSPDGKTILTDIREGTTQLWDAATRQPIGLPLKRPGGFRTATFSPDGKTIVTGSLDGTAQLWDAASGQPIGLPMRHEGQVRAVAFSPDGKTILTGGSDNTGRLWDAATGTVLSFLEHQGPAFHIAFSPDGKSLLTGSLDGTVRLWDAKIDQPVSRVLEQHVGVAGVMFSPDGKTILTDRLDGTARLWDAATGEPIATPFEQLGWASALAFSPDGKTFYSAARSKTARLRDSATALPIGPIFPLQDEVNAVAFSPDGKILMTGTNDGTIRLFDVSTGTLLGSPLTQPGVIFGVAFSPDGQTILAGGESGALQLWDVATRTRLGRPFPYPGAVMDVAFSPDGQTILTGGEDKTARLWDVATRTLLVPSLSHPNRVGGVAFSPDGKTILTGCADGLTRFFPIPELPEDLERATAWVEVLTGLSLDARRGSIQLLDNGAWRASRERLEQLGGPPETGPPRQLDPIAYGPDPTARARSWIERKCWAEAEAAFDEVVRARPLNSTVRMEQGQFFLKRSEPEKAVAAFGQAILLLPNESYLRIRQILSLVAAGDFDGQRQACSNLLDRFGNTTDPTTANNLAWSCALAPGSVAVHEALVRLAELAGQRFPAEQKHVVLNTLGAVLYRAGRFEDAIHRLDEGIQLRKGESLPQDWVFLAMAHHRLGHHDEARRWLDRLSNRPPSENPEQFWEELEIRLLRGEAEAVVLYDPVFPADPFAH
jgi:eukaryotic-like serine/threonine-protein kinase